VPGTSRLSLRDGQPGSIAVTQEVAYVAGYEVSQSREGCAIADPRIGVAREGVVLSARMVRAPDGSAIGLDLELETCALDRPMGERRVPFVRGGLPLTMQMASGVSRRLTLHSDLAPGEALVFGGSSLRDARDGRALVALVRLDPQDAAEPR
jgi:hypothetical protein